MKTALYAKINIAKTQLKLDEDVYRSILSDLTGKTSLTKMDIGELEKVINHFKACGFKPIKSKRRKSPSSKQPVKTPEIRKIRAIWITMANHGIVRDSSEAALDAYVARMTINLNQCIGVNSVAWLNSELAYKVLEALKAWHKREMLKRLSAIDITRDELGNALYKVPYLALVEAFEQAQKQGKV